jgi:ribosomal protein S21
MGVTQETQEPESDCCPASITFHDTVAPIGRIEVGRGDAGLELALKRLRRRLAETRSELRGRQFYTPPSEARKHKRLRAKARNRTLAKKLAKSL